MLFRNKSISLIALVVCFAFIAKAQTKKVLLEEFSGAHCGQCPMGAYTLDSLLDIYPNLIGVSLHSYIPADAMHFVQIDTIATPYAPGAPLGAIDRINFNDGWNYVAKLYQNWDTHVQTRLAVAPQMSVSLNATWNSATRNISVLVTANILANLPTGDYRFNLYVVEDSVTGSGSGYDQSNIYNSVTGNPFYGLGDPITGYVHRHVVRAILPASWGQAGIIAPTPIAGQSFSTTFNYVLPASYNENRIKLVAFVSGYTLNHQGDEVMNAAEINLPLQTRINESILVKNVFVYPNPTSGLFQITSHELRITNIEIYNVLGEMVLDLPINQSTSQPINLSSQPSGIYFVQIKTEQGRVVKKLVLSR